MLGIAVVVDVGRVIMVQLVNVLVVTLWIEITKDLVWKTAQNHLVYRAIKTRSKTYGIFDKIKGTTFRVAIVKHNIRYSFE